MVYELDYDYEAIQEAVLQQHGGSQNAQSQEEIEEFLIRMQNRIPFQFSIAREYKKSKEKLFIENVIDGSRNAVSPRYFRLRLKTLNERKGHWLDTGEFILSINPA